MKKTNNNTRSFRAKIGSYQYIFAPLLFGLYPVLFLYSRNIQEVPANLLPKPILIVILASLLLSGLTRWLVKDNSKTALIMILFWLFFFFYGPVFGYIDKLLPEALSRHSYSLPLWVLVFGGLVFLIKRSKRIDNRYLQFGMVAGIVMVALQIKGILGYSIAPPKLDSYQYLVNVEDKNLSPPNRPLPDIYYIMPDGYPRSDTLKEYFNFNNQGFDGFLEANGFYLASDSHSNYNQTGVSVPSTMNMSYIEDPKTESLSDATLYNLYHHNKVLDYLKSGGYKFINNSQLPSVKVNDWADFNVSCEKSNEFLVELIATTVLEPFKIISNQTRQDKQEDALCTIANIGGSGRPAPKFVFTHLLPPHPPYIFGADGEDVSEINLRLSGVDRWLAKEPYLAQLKFINKQISQQVDAILNQSKNSIIIIQSDHGTLSSATEATALLDTRPVVLKERSRNYLAIYLPDYCDKSKLYDSLTNVNTFRVIFNGCFGADYKLLQEKIYYVGSGPARFKNFEDITRVVKDKP